NQVPEWASASFNCLLAFSAEILANRERGRKLATLDLSNTEVTDAGMRDLASLEGLATLNLFGTQVTDAGLKNLSSLKNLISLQLGGTRVTIDGVVKLHKALPKCQIAWH